MNEWKEVSQNSSLPVGQAAGALTISASDRIRIAAAWEALSVNSRRSYQGAWDRCGQWLTDRGISIDDLSDEVMAVYIATLDSEDKSLRVGSAVSLAQAGASVIDMQNGGRWKSPQMPARYAKAELAERGSIARFKDGKEAR